MARLPRLRRPPWPFLAAALVGTAMLALVAVPAPYPAWLLAASGGIAVLAAVPGRWPGAGTLAAAACVALAAVDISAGSLSLPFAAAEAALVLAYLLTLDLAESAPTRGLAFWAWRAGAVLAGGIGVAAAAAAIAALPPVASAWLAFAGLAATVGALLVAVRALRR